MTPPHYVTLVTRTDWLTPTAQAACTNSYVAVAYLQAMAQEKGFPLTAIRTNRFYSIGGAKYSLTEVRLLDQSWVKEHEATQ